MFALIFVWLEVRARSFTKKGIVFDDPSLKYQLSPEELPNPDEEKDLPNVIVAILPIILILVLFNNPMHPFPVETSVFAGVALATILMFKRIKGVNAWIGVFNKGAADSGVAILNTAIVVGFGGVVKNTQGFADLVTALKGMSMPPLVFVMITVAICAGACGSASGGMGVAFNALTDTYLALGAKLPYIHRIATIAAGTLDTLPHQGAQITLLGICKLTHKEAYFDIAITQIIIPFITCGLFILLAFQFHKNHLAKISILIFDKFLYRCLINPRIMSPESNCFLLTIVCLADSRPLRPWIHSASLIRKFRHHFQLKNGFCTMTDRRSNTVISRIATTDDNYIFALCRNIFAFFQLHLIFPETFRS